MGGSLLWNFLEQVSSFSEGFILICIVDFEILVDFGVVNFLLQAIEKVILYENTGFFVNFGKIDWEG